MEGGRGVFPMPSLYSIYQIMFYMPKSVFGGKTCMIFVKNGEVESDQCRQLSVDKDGNTGFDTFDSFLSVYSMDSHMNY